MKNLIHAALTALLAVALIAVGLVEIRWHVIERFIGAYMDARNDSRDRLERFVDQESRTNQALEHANRLIEERSQVTLDELDGPVRTDARSSPASDVVRLDRGHKLIMTRDRFLAIPRWHTGVGHHTVTQTARQDARPDGGTIEPAGSDTRAPSGGGTYGLSGEEAYEPAAARSDARPGSTTAFEPDSLEEWTRAVVIRPGWIRRGEVYMVDDENYILRRQPISVEQFDLIDAYAAAAEGRMHEDLEHEFEPGMFFDTLRSLDQETRDEIIDPLQFRDLEDSAQRVGVSEKQRIIQIERLADGRIDVVTIPVSAVLFVELYVALGAL